MAILGLGTDIVEIARIQDAIGRSEEKFAARILTATEWGQYQQHRQQAHFLAKRFAAKEAAAKALGCGIRDGLAFNQFEILNDSKGKPILSFHGRAAEMARELGVSAIHLTLADERHYACATVILEGERP